MRDSHMRTRQEIVQLYIHMIIYSYSSMPSSSVVEAGTPLAPLKSSTKSWNRLPTSSQTNCHIKHVRSKTKKNNKKQPTSSVSRRWWVMCTYSAIIHIYAKHYTFLTVPPLTWLDGPRRALVVTKPCSWLVVAPNRWYLQRRTNH